MNLVTLVPVNRAGNNIAASVLRNKRLDVFSVETEDNEDVFEVARRVSGSLSLDFNELVRHISLSPMSVSVNYTEYGDIHVFSLSALTMQSCFSIQMLMSGGLAESSMNVCSPLVSLRKYLHPLWQLYVVFGFAMSAVVELSQPMLSGTVVKYIKLQLLRMESSRVIVVMFLELVPLWRIFRRFYRNTLTQITHTCLLLRWKFMMHLVHILSHMQILLDIL